jgi:hypothetical protein
MIAFSMRCCSEFLRVGSVVKGYNVAVILQHKRGMELSSMLIWRSLVDRKH